MAQLISFLHGLKAEIWGFKSMQLILKMMQKQRNYIEIKSNQDIKARILLKRKRKELERERKKQKRTEANKMKRIRTFEVVLFCFVVV